MNIYGGLLFNQGHVQDPETARMLAGASAETPASEAGPRPTGGAGMREDAARLAQARGGLGGVELWAALVSALR